LREAWDVPVAKEVVAVKALLKIALDPTVKPRDRTVAARVLLGAARLNVPVAKRIEVVEALLKIALDPNATPRVRTATGRVLLGAGRQNVPAIRESLAVDDRDLLTERLAKIEAQIDSLGNQGSQHPRREK